MNRIEIVTERLTLMPLGTEHFQTAKEYSMDYENTKYMCRLPHETGEETMHFLTCVDAEWKKEKPEYYEFAIFYEGKHIGVVSIYFENGAGELGWILNKKYWGNGFAYEAAKAMIEYFAVNMGTSHFVAHCDAENIASYKIMEKLGMRKIGGQSKRRNRAASQDSFEYRYEMFAPNCDLDCAMKRDVN